MTPQRLADVLLVGSLPFTTVEDAFRGAATLGSDVVALPDGEVGERQGWVEYLASETYAKHADLVETRTPTKFVPEPDDPGLPGSGREYHWTFALKPGVEDVRFDSLHYADVAIESYATFLRLRDEGVIARGVRFQVSIPAISSGVDMYFERSEEWPIVHRAYADAVRREIARITEAVPADDLLIQFDLAWEVNDLDIGDGQYYDFWPQTTYDEKFARHTGLLVELTPAVPDDVLLGLHWCYGTWGGWPMTDMSDLRLCVDLSNEAVARAGRRLDYVHMPVTRQPDATFFEPLRDLRIGDTKVYLGLVHHQDGIEGSRRRIELAQRVLPSFGVAAVCGYGREDPEEVRGAFELLRASARALHD